MLPYDATVPSSSLLADDATTGDPMAALLHARRDPRDAKSTDLDSARATLRLARLEWQQTHPQAAPLARSALAAFECLDDPRGQAAARRLLAAIAHYEGRTAEGIEHLEAARTLSRDAGDLDLEVDCLQDLAASWQAHGDHTRVLAVQTALRDLLGDHTPPSRRLPFLRDLTVTYFLLGRLSDVVTDPSATLGLDPVRDRRTLSVVLKDAADTVSTIGRHDEALLAFEAALTLAREANDGRQQIEVSYGLIWAHRCLGNVTRTRDCFEEALAVARALDDETTEAVLQQNLGTWAVEIADVPLAVEALGRTTVLARRTGQMELERAAWLHLMQIEDGDTGRALGHLEAYLDVERRLHRHEVEHGRRGHGLLVKRDLGRSRLSATLLRSFNDELHRVNQELQRAQRENEDLLARLSVQAREDALTGLSNRRHFLDVLRDELARVARFGEPVAVALIDVDHFKRINDGFSHATGDEVLREVATVLRRGCRAIDTVARYGGEEFALLLPGTTAEGARVLCERLRLAIAGHDWTALGEGLSVTVSIGLTDEPGTPEQRLHAADLRLYQAKHEGRNTVRG